MKNTQQPLHTQRKGGERLRGFLLVLELVLSAWPPGSARYSAQPSFPLPAAAGLHLSVFAGAGHSQAGLTCQQLPVQVGPVHRQNVLEDSRGT